MITNKLTKCYLNKIEEASWHNTLSAMAAGTLGQESKNEGVEKCLYAPRLNTLGRSNKCVWSKQMKT